MLDLGQVLVMGVPTLYKVCGPSVGTFNCKYNFIGK